ncbi:MAG TPA: NAD-dependent succinate-semialdehyde dehydrogenase [Gemmatimonadaceae bacterium]|nr:NAD-dependent succinate-semialdehyde dehydrogenase [Gemmatimonadaceae bacterium]
MGIATVNPATGETIREYSALAADEMELRLARAAAAAREWRARPLTERTAVVRRIGDLLLERKARYADLMTTEMGKPIRAAHDEAAKCADACYFFADHAAEFLAREPVAMKNEKAWVEFHPLGVVLAVMPWNFPFWQVIRFAAPALCAGNVGLLKHASNVPQCALALEELATDAGAPAGVFQSLLIGSDAVDAVIADPRVAAVTLTGSNAAGEAVAARAGRSIKKTVLELGGSDPFIVMPSADLETAVTTAVRARAINNGQSCIAAKRFIVAEGVYDAFVSRFVAEMKALKVGDPMREDTQIGPLATSAIRDELHAQVERSVAAGARVLTGGRPIQGRGWFYEPTVVVDAPRHSPVVREETFGPVAVVIRARDTGDAIEIANDSPFGLGSAVWTRDGDEARRFATGIEAGTVVINGMMASDSRLPFGGVKQSGYGRELGAYGLREFVNVKTIRVKDVDLSG